MSSNIMNSSVPHNNVTGAALIQAPKLKKKTNCKDGKRPDDRGICRKRNLKKLRDKDASTKYNFNDDTPKITIELGDQNYLQEDSSDMPEDVANEGTKLKENSPAAPVIRVPHRPCTGDMLYVSLVIISCGFCYNLDADAEHAHQDHNMVKLLGSPIYSVRTATENGYRLSTMQKRAVGTILNDIKNNNTTPSPTTEDDELPDDVANEGGKVKEASPGAALIVAPKRKCPKGYGLEARTGICRKLW
ncbi:hypothetical protein GE061_014911 [Apolygus lucorum]|uniref:Uncharacterized protein n=1 Tax=Apolygus lucorum TaxID=248454 RepID=A0A8S9XMB1_APOLU|nr:hypothetical protein GE061_014911 [Apolygus lucorum]